MRIAFILLLSFVTSNLLAQTKEIAFKSHSGNMANFNTTINNGFFDNEDGGYGLPVPTKIKTYKLDSVFFISDTISVIVIREYQRNEFEADKATKLVKVSKDTIYHDPLLGHKHSLDSIRSELGKLGYEGDPINKVVFVGYDNSKGKKKVKEIELDKNKEKERNTLAPVHIDGGSGNSPLDSQWMLMLGSILFLSLLGGWISWKFYQPRFR
jgi:hypothetical protein